MSHEAAADELIWYQPQRRHREFELRRGQERLATLRFEPAPVISWSLTNRQRASAETPDGRWRFSVIRHGFLGLKGTIRVEGTPAAVLEAGFLLFGGMLTMAGMPALRWTGGLWSHSSDSFTDLQGAPVLRLDRGDFFERINARVAILSATAPPRVVPLLACLGFYMRLLMNKVYD